MIFLLMRYREESCCPSGKKGSSLRRDDKILSGINALLAIAMIQAGRLLDEPELEEKAAALDKKDY